MVSYLYLVTYLLTYVLTMQLQVPGAELDRMVSGITAHHAAVRDHNPAWLLDLLCQMPSAPSAVDSNQGGGIDLLRQVPADSSEGVARSEESDCEEERGGCERLDVREPGGRSIMRPADLRAMAHRLGPWWI